MSAQIGYGWDFGYGFTSGLNSNITITPISYSSAVASSQCTLSASANSTATVTGYMWSDNISGNFVNGSWITFTGNPIALTVTLGSNRGLINTFVLYVNDSSGTIGSNSVSVLLTASSVGKISDDLLTSIELFAVLPIIVGASVFVLVLKGFSDKGDSYESVLPALFSAIITIVMIEIMLYIVVFVISAFNG